MRLKHTSLVGAATIALISIVVLPVLACPPGYSPGYWKHQFNAWIDGKGKPHISLSDLESLTTTINSHWGEDPAPYWDGYQLLPVSEFDYDEDGQFEIYDAYSIFNDPSWNYKWIPLANWYNYAAGLAPWI